MDILPQLLVNALIAGSIYALASSGLSLSYGLLRILNFAHGHVMMVGVYFFYLMVAQWELGLVAGSLATLVFSIVLGLFSLGIFIQPFYRISFLLVLVSTMALSIMFESVVSMIFGVNVKSLSTGAAVQSLNFWGIYITPIQILIIVSSLLLLSILAFMVHSTSLGRLVRALKEDSYAAQSLGISQLRSNCLMFVIATLLAVYAGILVGYETNIQPTMGNIYTIKAFAAMVLGGLGNIWGTVAGAYLLGLVENLAIGLDFGPYSIPAGYKDAFSFMIILFVLLFKPEGLFSRARRKV